MIHWHWIVFTVVVILLLRGMGSGKVGGDYSFDIMPPFYLVLLIAFVLVWGGIFWW